MVSGLIAVLSVCHEMHAFTRPGANEYIGEVGASHFRHIKSYIASVVGRLATLCGDAEDFYFCGVYSLAGGGVEVLGVFVAGTPATKDVWIVEEGLHVKLKEAPVGTNRDGA